MDQPISKTLRKKNMHALQRLGEQLVALNPAQLEQLGLAEKLRDAVIEARKLKKNEARRRQMQYIGRLMRGIEAAPIRQRLDSLLGPQKQHQAWLNLIERWRERLLQDEAGLGEFRDFYPQADLQLLCILVGDAKREALLSLPPKNYRELFRELCKLIPRK